MELLGIEKNPTASDEVRKRFFCLPAFVINTLYVMKYLADSHHADLKELIPLSMSFPDVTNRTML